MMDREMIANTRNFEMRIRFTLPQCPLCSMEPMTVIGLVVYYGVGVCICYNNSRTFFRSKTLNFSTLISANNIAVHEQVFHSEVKSCKGPIHGYSE